MKKIIIAALLTAVIVAALNFNQNKPRPVINFKNGTLFKSQEDLEQVFSDPSAKRYVAQVFGSM
jgi:hypothetical protein